MLFDRGYKFAHFDGLNRFYVAEEHRELLAAFKSPPNVFDCFSLSGTSSSTFHRHLAARHAQQLADSAAELARLHQSVEQKNDEHAARIAAVEAQAAERASGDAATLAATRQASEEQLAVLQRSIEERQVKFEREAAQLNEHIERLLDAARERDAQEAAERQRNVETERALRALLSATVEQMGAAQRDLTQFHLDSASARRAHEAEARQLLDRIEELNAERLSQVRALAELERHHADARREIEQSAAARLASAQEQWREAGHRAADSHSRELQTVLAAMEERTALAQRLSHELGEARGALAVLRDKPLNRLLALVSPERSRPLRGPSQGRNPLDAPAHEEPMPAVNPPPLSTAGPTTMKNPVLNDLLILNDIDFVRAAYQAVLKRPADPSGEQSYLTRLRQGHDRVRMLADMARSEEGRRAGAVIIGLDQAVRWNRLGRLPVLGPLLVGVRSLLRRVPSPDPVAAFDNQSYGLQRTTLDLVVEIQASIQRLQQQQASMEQTLRRMSEQQSDIAAAVISMQGGSDLSALRVSVSSGPSAMGDPALQQVQLVRRAAAWEV